MQCGWVRPQSTEYQYEFSALWVRLAHVGLAQQCAWSLNGWVLARGLIPQTSAYDPLLR